MSTDLRLLRGRSAEVVRIRSIPGYELTSEDGRIDLVAVDLALRGRPVQLNAYELDEVCRVLDDLRHTYHEDGMPIGRYDDRRSPYLIIKDLLTEAYGPQFDVLYKRYRDKIAHRRHRAQKELAS